MKPINREDLVSVLFQYQVGLNRVKKIVIADITQYSAFTDEAEVLVDIGAALVNEYIEYQKKKMVDANIVVMFGHLLVEMGEYDKS